MSAAPFWEYATATEAAEREFAAVVDPAFVAFLALKEAADVRRKAAIAAPYAAFIQSWIGAQP